MGVTFGDRRWLRRLGWATLAGNIGIVLTGGAVRLTASGLGCPTWPRCTDTSFTPHGALDYHSAMADERQGLRRELSEDGVHPNEAGYRVMAPLAERAIAEALRRP